MSKRDINCDMRKAVMNELEGGKKLERKLFNVIDYRY